MVKGKVLDASSNFASCHSEMSGFSGLGGVSTAQLGGTVSGSINFPWQPCMTSLTFTQPHPVRSSTGNNPKYIFCNHRKMPFANPLLDTIKILIYVAHVWLFSFSTCYRLSKHSVLTFFARLEGVSFALFLQSGFLCDVFNLLKTLTLDVIVCSHAPPASLYLSLFSLLAVDIRGKKPSKNFMTNFFFLKKSTSSSTLLRLTGQKSKGIHFSAG